MAELVDARDLKSLDGNVVWVRLPPPAPRFALAGYAWRSHVTPAGRILSGAAWRSEGKDDFDERQCGVTMTDDKDDLFGEGTDEALDEFDRLTEILSQRVFEFAEEEDVDDEALSPLLFRLALSARMVAYASGTAKPSAGGLKLDLDRFRRDIEDVVRAAKKDADYFIEQAKASLAAAEQDEDES